jgi:hypothetical protein
MRHAREQRTKRPRAAAGFVVKSGWAAVVLMAGASKSPHVADSRRVELSDPAVPAARQPYHDGFATARRNGPRLDRLLATIAAFGRRAVSDALGDFTAQNYDLSGAGIVVGSLVDPGSIANEHIRIHALEGRLFRGIVEEAATTSGLTCTTWRERDLYGAATRILKQPEDAMRGRLTILGRGAHGGWRAEQKMAALAAWLVLQTTPRQTL